jgi:hypothetical protein
MYLAIWICSLSYCFCKTAEREAPSAVGNFEIDKKV